LKFASFGDAELSPVISGWRVAWSTEQKTKQIKDTVDVKRQK